MARIFWFRRDLRLQDNVSLNAAAAGAQADGDNKVCGLFAFNSDSFLKLSGIRQWSLQASLEALSASMDGQLVIQQSESGQIAKSIVEAAAKANVKVVHATRAFDPDGVDEQNKVGLALQAEGVFLQLDDSYYAVAPGKVLKSDGSPYRVYTPFFNNWFAAGWPSPVALAEGFEWFKAVSGHALPIPSKKSPIDVRAGEAFALRTFDRFSERALLNYDELRNRPDLSGTSHLSHALAFGEIHPRTILAKLGDSAGENVYRKEIAWREFYADVLWNNPTTVSEYYEPRFKKMRYDSGELAENRLEAWKQGQTGFPMVDAGMRQLLQTGWMHNRVRMIVASFLIKDLHLEWQLGADWFAENLSDFDPASNSHGWQWTAGCGTDASPYYRIFNPIMQGYKFDPDGDYVRKFVPELGHITDKSVHEPWLLVDGLINGYPQPIVDHAIERNESLARLAEIKVS
jgi:deoxyribodipyrimidine photo-lyase